MKCSVMICKQNADGTETILPGSFANDKEALAAVTEPGKYVIYPVHEVSKEDLKKD